MHYTKQKKTWWGDTPSPFTHTNITLNMCLPPKSIPKTEWTFPPYSHCKVSAPKQRKSVKHSKIPS